MRMLDDLADEGYTELNEQLEKNFCGVSRLRNYLKRNHVEPFLFSEKRQNADVFRYSEYDTELCGAIVQAMNAASKLPQAASSPFADKLCRFCNWIGYDDNTAYIFLLRDTLLPYIYYAERCRRRIYPWLLSRKSFAALAGRQNADDEIRASIYRALEAGCADFQSFIQFALPDIRQTIENYQKAKSVLCSMLRNIDAERIIVVESGCTGTFPLLLMSLDDRVDMRMYTSYPYLTGIFGGRIFTSRYEENRMFETLVSHELYFNFSKIQNGMFYVQTCMDETVEKQALKEIEMMQSVQTGE